MKTQRINSDSIPTSRAPTFFSFPTQNHKRSISENRETSCFLPDFWSMSGSGGLKGRVSHHLRINRKCHRHIDYLLQKMPVGQIMYTETPSRLVHEWAMLLERIPELNIPMKRFGASDCQCASHLFHIPSKIKTINIELKFKRIFKVNFCSEIHQMLNKMNVH